MNDMLNQTDPATATAPDDPKKDSTTPDPSCCTAPPGGDPGPGGAITT